MLAVPRHFITCNDVTGNYSTTSVRARARELFVALTALHFSILFWLELQGTLSMPNLRKKKSRISAITLKTRKVERQPHVLVISADPKKKKVACRVVIMLVLRRKGQPPVPVIGLTLRRRGQLPG